MKTVMSKFTVAAVSVLAIPAVLTVAPAHAAPALPGFCVPANVVDGVCTARLSTVTADVVNGTIAGSPVGGGEAVTLAGQADAYLLSAGTTPRPEAVTSWDTAIEQVSTLDVDPTDPSWYGNAKARVFLPRTLNDLATRFPPDTLVVRFAPGDPASPTFELVSIQPTLP
jgi:hypothetical protein